MSPVASMMTFWSTRLCCRPNLPTESSRDARPFRHRWSWSKGFGDARRKLSWIVRTSIRIHSRSARIFSWPARTLVRAPVHPSLAYDRFRTPFSSCHDQQPPAAPILPDRIRNRKTLSFSSFFFPTRCYFVCETSPGARRTALRRLGWKTRRRLLALPMETNDCKWSNWVEMVFYAPTPIHFVATNLYRFVWRIPFLYDDLIPSQPKRISALIPPKTKTNLALILRRRFGGWKRKAT